MGLKQIENIENFKTACAEVLLKFIRIMSTLFNGFELFYDINGLGLEKYMDYFTGLRVILL